MLMPSIGRYAIERELGRGAMGIVYLATDPQLHRQVAVKTCALPDGICAEQAALYRERFLREARAAAGLSHPGIVTVYDAGEDGTSGVPYIAMEYVQGRTLRQRLEQGDRLDPAWVVAFGGVLADALQQAHRAGIVHRDIKPANILIRDGDGAVKLADFGVARLKASDLTQSGVPLGSPGYMSPEQVRGGDLDGRSDLFSLAVVLYEALCGTRPFRGDEMVSLAYSIAHESHIPLSRQLTNGPAGLDAFFDRALSKDPAGRFPDGVAFRKALLEVGAGPGAGLAADPSDGTVADARTVGMMTDPRTIAMAPAAAAGTPRPPVAPRPAGKRAIPAGARRSPARRLAFAALALLLVGLPVAAYFALGGPAVKKAVGRVPVAAPRPAAADAPLPGTPAARPKSAALQESAPPVEVEPVPIPPRAPKYDEVTLPAGTAIHLALEVTAGSATSRAGDDLTATITDPVVIRDRVALPAGSRVHGFVIEATAAKRGLADKAGVLRLAFDKVVTPAGFGAAMTAGLTSTGAGSGRQTAAAIGGGAAGGALLGRILGHRARSAAIGTALGGAIGTGVAAGTRGEDVTLPSGAPLIVTLDQRLTISVNP